MVEMVIMMMIVVVVGYDDHQPFFDQLANLFFINEIHDRVFLHSLLPAFLLFSNFLFFVHPLSPSLSSSSDACFHHLFHSTSSAGAVSRHLFDPA